MNQFSNLLLEHLNFLKSFKQLLSPPVGNISHRAHLPSSGAPPLSSHNPLGGVLRCDSPPKWSQHLNVLSAAAVSVANHLGDYHHPHVSKHHSPTVDPGCPPGTGHPPPPGGPPQGPPSLPQTPHPAYPSTSSPMSMHQHPASVSSGPHSTISTQFSALLGSSPGYLLASESKTMPIF